MAEKINPDKKEARSEQRTDITNMDVLSLDEFKAELVQRGFEPGSRNHNNFTNNIIPDFRFIVRKKVVRLEKKDQSSTGRKWRIDSSYLISRDLQIAINAVEHLNFDSEIIVERKEIRPRGELLAYIVLCSLLFVGGGLSIFYRVFLSLLVFCICVGLGIVFLGLARKLLILRSKIVSSSSRSVASVIGRQIIDDWHDDNPYYYLSIIFTPSGLESSGQQVIIRALVKEQIYKSFLNGSNIEIEYANEDPRILILEGEKM